MDPETDARFRKAVQPGPDREFAAVVVAASNRDGSKRYTKAYGTRGIADTTPIQEDAVFWIASCTKLLTGIAALQCVERGLFALDSTADVARLVPEYAAPEVVEWADGEAGGVVTRPASRTFTLRELLTMSSGLPYDFTAPEIVAWRRQMRGTKEWASWSAFDKAYRTPLVADPGSSWMYGTSLEWAQVMVERATGLSLGAYLAQHILQPLGMSSTAFFVDGTPLAARAVPGVTRTDEGLVDGAPPAMARRNVAIESGGGGLHSSADDYMRVLLSLLRNDGRLLPPPTVRAMMQSQLPAASAEAQDRMFALPTVARMMHEGASPGCRWQYGLAGDVLQNDDPGKMNRGLFAWGGLPNIIWFLHPKDGYCGIMLTHLYPLGDQGTEEIRDFWYRQLYKEFGAAAGAASGASKI